MTPWLLPDIFKADIKDKSKADALAKAIVCIQSIWFMVQSIGRMTSVDCSMSFLEWKTFLHAVSYLIVYGLWWDSPYDATRPFLITDLRIHDLCAYLFFYQNDTHLKIPQCENLIAKAQQYAPTVDITSYEALSTALRIGCARELMQVQEKSNSNNAKEFNHEQPLQDQYGLMDEGVTGEERSDNGDGRTEDEGLLIGAELANDEDRRNEEGRHVPTQQLPDRDGSLDEGWGDAAHLRDQSDVLHLCIPGTLGRVKTSVSAQGFKGP
ncbi:hypothetical protein BU23DRAFT_573344 [Bimuria novae-zelandiae CBS 107.79]|uniref:Uncharacterized protein n=1 Tax=Bimuria novae-zelandiae CBS 107.79 TaxID=1447943 RepID=A0A6A5USG1_9PLEO|nr:hypothetical protein BU23DRAFT_573344 [Bimuria novae-zelandiae CBS 107.79]